MAPHWLDGCIVRSGVRPCRHEAPVCSPLRRVKRAPVVSSPRRMRPPRAVFASSKPRVRADSVAHHALRVDEYAARSRCAVRVRLEVPTWRSGPPDRDRTGHAAGVAPVPAGWWRAPQRPLNFLHTCPGRALRQRPAEIARSMRCEIPSGVAGGVDRSGAEGRPNPRRRTVASRLCAICRTACGPPELTGATPRLPRRSAAPARRRSTRRANPGVARTRGVDAFEIARSEEWAPAWRHASAERDPSTRASSPSLPYPRRRRGGLC